MKLKLLPLFMLLACGDDGLSVVVEEGQVNFTEVFNVLESRCTPCHNPGKAGGLTWTDAQSAYLTLVTDISASSMCYGKLWVTPGDAKESLLFNKLSMAPVCGNKMPPKADLTPEEAEIIELWINQGAMFIP